MRNSHLVILTIVLQQNESPFSPLLGHETISVDNKVLGQLHKWNGVEAIGCLGGFKAALESLHNCPSHLCAIYILDAKEVASQCQRKPIYQVLKVEINTSAKSLSIRTDF